MSAATRAATTTPTLVLDTMGAPRPGAEPADWEDAAAISPRGRRFVVADGASSSFRAREWSRLLTSSLVAEPAGADGLVERVTELDRRFGAGQPQEAAPYYARIAAERGAQATLLQVSVEGLPARPTRDAGASGRWRALAIGDSCLFHCRGGALLRAFPVADPDAFGNVTDLVSTSRGERAPFVPPPQQAEGELLAGDVLFGATDALSRWLLGADRAGVPMWDVFAALPVAAFPAAVERARATGMVDDDVTLVRAHWAVVGGEPASARLGS